MPDVDIDREAAHEAAQRELSKPIYPTESFLKRLSDWFDEFLYRVMLKGSSIPGGWLTITVLAILVAIALIVGVRIARRTMGTNRSADPGLYGAHVLSAQEHRAIAEAAAAQGDWAAAIRHRLRAVARQLEEAGVVDPVAGRTANELARDAGASLPDAAVDLSRAATAFNDVTYGEQPGSEPNYRLVADLDERLRGHTAVTAKGAGSTSASDGWATVR